MADDINIDIDISPSLGELPLVVLPEISEVNYSRKRKIIKRLCIAKAKMQIKNSPFGALFCACYCGRSQVTEETIPADEESEETVTTINPQ